MNHFSALLTIPCCKTASRVNLAFNIFLRNDCCSGLLMLVCVMGRLENQAERRLATRMTATTRIHTVWVSKLNEGEPTHETIHENILIPYLPK